MSLEYWLTTCLLVISLGQTLVLYRAFSVYDRQGAELLRVRAQRDRSASEARQWRDQSGADREFLEELRRANGKTPYPSREDADPLHRGAAPPSEPVARRRFTATPPRDPNAETVELRAIGSGPRRHRSGGRVSEWT